MVNEKVPDLLLRRLALTHAQTAQNHQEEFCLLLKMYVTSLQNVKHDPLPTVSCLTKLRWLDKRVSLLLAKKEGVWFVMRLMRSIFKYLKILYRILIQ